jgi:hypothetical protein
MYYGIFDRFFLRMPVYTSVLNMEHVLPKRRYISFLRVTRVMYVFSSGYGYCPVK